MHIRTRLLSAALSLTLATGLLPVLPAPAFADDQTESVIAEEALVEDEPEDGTSEDEDSPDALTTSYTLTKGWNQFGSTEWLIDSAGKLTIRPLGNGPEGTMGEFDVFQEGPWDDSIDAIVSVYIAPGVKAGRSLEYMFSNATNMKTAKLANLDTSNVTDMTGMFYKCYDLASLDVSGFDTSSARFMHGMFEYCESLTSLDLSGFDTSEVEDMGYMFDGCYNLASLDLSSFDTAEVEDMGSMFDGCCNLASLDLSGFDTSKVKNMGYMFDDCYNLTSLDLSSFDTAEVESMKYMFYGCMSLTSLDLSGFDTSKVESMRNMFNICASLTSLDLSGFDTSKVKDMGKMFYQCVDLRTIYASELFSTASVTDSSDMFSYCGSLKGGNGTTFNGSYTDASRARIDKSGQPGYFTYRSKYMSIVAYGPSGTYLVRWKPATPVTGVATYNGAKMTWDARAKCWKYLTATNNKNLSASNFGSTSGTPTTINGEGTVRGDLNENGALTVVDAQIAYDLATGAYSGFSTVSRAKWLAADFNNDGFLDAADAFAIQSKAIRG